MKQRKLPSNQQIQGISATLGDFWSWAYSDVLVNTNRSVFAEFLVGFALGEVDRPRVEWDATDFTFHEKPIEVKSSAYLQSWPQRKLSTISFEITEKRTYSYETNKYSKKPMRSAFCYVFCLYTPTNHERHNVLDVSLWKFYPVLTEIINQEFGKQKRVGLKGIEKLTSGVSFDRLRLAFEKLVD